MLPDGVFTRGEFLKGVGAFAALSTLGCDLVEPLVRPNILILVTDDQPFYTMGGMPNTTASLGQGVEFTRSYCAAPLCAPNRASIMTGRYPHNHEVKRNDNATRRFRKLGWTRDSIGVNLANEAGYTCGYFGKWLNQYDDMPSYVAPGYGRWAATLSKRNPVKANVQGILRKPQMDGNNVPEHYESKWVGQKAQNFIADASVDSEPWFCVASFQGPHDPYTVSPENDDLYASATMPLRDNFDHYDPNKPRFYRREQALTNTEKTDYRDAWRGKMGEIADVDDAIGLLLADVDFETTYVFFMTDNGYLLGEHRLFAKGAPYDESSRTPLFVRGPSARSSAQDNHLVSSVDIAPTCYELAGLQALADECDGRSLTGLLVGAENPEWRDGLLVEQAHDETGLSGDIPGWQALRTDTALYVEHATGEQEYYDMTADPYQLTNLAPQTDPVTLYEMSSRLTAMKDAGGEDLRTAETSV